jgi:hypothetical protein
MFRLNSKCHIHLRFGLPVQTTVSECGYSWIDYGLFRQIQALKINKKYDRFTVMSCGGDFLFTTGRTCEYK